MTNSPITCIILALNRWNYYSGEQGLTAQHYCKIAQSSSYSWTMYRNQNKWNKLLSPSVTPSATRSHTSSDSMNPYEANIERKMLGCQALFSRENVQISSVNTAQTIVDLLAQFWGELWPNSPKYSYCKTIHTSLFDTNQWVDYLLRPRTAHHMESWCWSVVVMYAEI